MAGERILIVDDSREIVDFLLAILKPRGYILSATGDGKDGLTKAVYEAPDLVLLDLNLPGMSGIAILEALHHRKLDTPVIVMTFHGAESVVERALRLGARGYLIKPFEVDDILAAIERVLREERARRTQELFDDDLSGLQPEYMLDAATFAAYVASLSATSSRQALLAKLTEVALPVAAASVSAVFLRNGGAGLTLAGLRVENVYRTDANVSDAHADSVMHSCQPAYVQGSSAPPTFAAHLGLQVHTLLYVPLLLREKAVGVLCTGYRQSNRSPTASTEGWLLALGGYGALLLENVRLRELLRQSVPVQKARDVLSLLLRRAVKPLQALWQVGEILGSQPENQAVGEMLARQAQTIAAFLSIARDIATPRSRIFIGTVPVPTIEKEIDARLRALSKADDQG